MKYYQARKRESDGRWDYTCRHDKYIYAVGYCAGWQEFKGIDGLDPEVFDHFRRDYENKYRPLQSKYHEDGHATEAEAVECYRQYLLDTELKTMLDDEPGDCKACGILTDYYALLPHGVRWHLCATHNNRFVIEKIYGSPTSIVSSY